MSASKTRDKCRCIESRLFTTGVRVTFALMLILNVFAAPAAAQGSTPKLCDGDSAASSAGAQKFVSLVETIIQLSIFGGVALGVAMYLGAEAAETGWLGKQRTQKVKQVKRNGLGKALKLSVVPMLLALLLRSSSLAWGQCIDIIPF